MTFRFKTTGWVVLKSLISAAAQRHDEERGRKPKACCSASFLISSQCIVFSQKSIEKSSMRYVVWKRSPRCATKPSEALVKEFHEMKQPFQPFRRIFPIKISLYAVCHKTYLYIAQKNEAE